MRIAIKSTLIRSTILATAFGFAIGLAGAQAETIITDDIFPFPSEWTDNDNNFADDDPPRGVIISGTSGSLRVDGGQQSNRRKFDLGVQRKRYQQGVGLVWKI